MKDDPNLQETKKTFINRSIRITKRCDNCRYLVEIASRIGLWGCNSCSALGSKLNFHKIEQLYSVRILRPACDPA